MPPVTSRDGAQGSEDSCAKLCRTGEPRRGGSCRSRPETLPAQGVLLKNYYGTGHFSQDNYISMASGQATLPDVQADCPLYDQITGTIDSSGSLAGNPNYGQLVSAQGPNAAAGAGGDQAHRLVGLRRRDRLRGPHRGAIKPRVGAVSEIDVPATPITTCTFGS
jgi:hypothetical protein